MLKRAVVSTTIAMLAMVAPMLSTSAATTSHTSPVLLHPFSSTTFSKPVKLTNKQLTDLKAKAIPATQSSYEDYGFPKMTIQPNTTSPNWSYTGLYPGSYIDTIASYNVTTTGEQVVVKIVQYPSGICYCGAVADATYQLIPQGYGVTTSAYEVNGNFDSTADTFSFYNVSAGTYKLRITNITNKNGNVGTDMDGNGYVTYY